MKSTTYNYIVVILMLMSLYVFLMGFHASDTCQNLKFINSQLEGKGIQFHESSTINSYIDTDTCYKKGLFMQLMSFMFVLFMTNYLLFFNQQNECLYKEQSSISLCDKEEKP